MVVLTDVVVDSRPDVEFEVLDAYTGGSIEASLCSVEDVDVDVDDEVCEGTVVDGDPGLAGKTAKSLSAQAKHNILHADHPSRQRKHSLRIDFRKTSFLAVVRSHRPILARSAKPPPTTDRNKCMPPTHPGQHNAAVTSPFPATAPRDAVT